MTETSVDAGAKRDVPADTFPARLMLARLHAGNLTIREAAGRCDVKHESWSSWERGGKPRDLLAVVEAISAGLGIDRDWLLFGGPLARDQPRHRRTHTRGGITYGKGGTATNSRWSSQAKRPGAHHPKVGPPPGSPPGPEHTTPAPSTRRPARLPKAAA